MPTESRPRSFKQVLAESLARGLAEYQVKRQEKLDDEASIGRQQMVMAQQEQERQMKMAEHKAKLDEVNMQIRRHTIEMAMTPEQRMKLEYRLRAENEAAARDAAQQNKIALLNEATKRGFVPSGMKTTNTDALKGKLATLFSTLSGQQAGIEKANVATKSQHAKAVAETIANNKLVQNNPDLIAPLPVMPDTLAHLNIPAIMAPFGEFFGTGAPSMAVPNTQQEQDVDAEIKKLLEELGYGK